MVVLKRELGPKEISRKPEDPGKSPKAKLTIFGEEVIEKEVKPGGNAGRVYLLWVGWASSSKSFAPIDGERDGLEIDQDTDSVKGHGKK
jgi:hypothetical protein